MNSKLLVGDDVSFNRNAMIDSHLSIGTTPFTESVSSLVNADEQLTFTIPLHLDTLKYFCTTHSLMQVQLT